MYDNYNYPMGADTPDAPWNQTEPDPVSVCVTVSQSFMRTTDIQTDRYTEDEDGYKEFYELNSTYKEQAYTPLELMEKFKEVLEEVKKGQLPKMNRSEIAFLINECEDWCNCEDEYDITKEN